VGILCRESGIGVALAAPEVAEADDFQGLAAVEPSECFVVEKGDAGVLEQAADVAVVGVRVMAGVAVPGVDGSVVIAQAGEAGGLAGQTLKHVLVSLGIRNDGTGDKITG
jgi:hypothetical protein